jgi:hypothetical protein
VALHRRHGKYAGKPSVARILGRTFSQVNRIVTNPGIARTHNPPIRGTSQAPEWMICAQPCCEILRPPAAQNRRSERPRPIHDIRDSHSPCLQPRPHRRSPEARRRWRLDLPWREDRKASAKPSDNEPRQRQTVRDVPRRHTPAGPTLTRPSATLADETGMHGMQKVRGSNPLSSTGFPDLCSVAKSQPSA